MLSRIALVSFFTLCLSLPASAEFFKYIDENGNVRYTDDFSKVPKDQQTKIRQYNTPDYEEPAPADAGDAASEESSEGADPGKKAEDVIEERARLERVKLELDREFEAIQQERAKLAEQSKKTTTEESRKAYNEKVVELNEKIKKYEEKRQQFNAQVEAFNAQPQ